MVVEISKRDSSYSFHPTLANFYEDIAYHMGDTGCSFSWHWAMLKSHKMLNILKTADRRGNGRKFGIVIPRNCICWIIYMSDFF